MLYLLYLFIRKIELPHYYASLKLLFFFIFIGESLLISSLLGKVLRALVDIARLAEI